VAHNSESINPNDQNPESQDGSNISPAFSKKGIDSVKQLHDTGETSKRSIQTLQDYALYHSRRRRYIELDVLLGTFADHKVPQMTERELIDFCRLLDEENDDLFVCLTGASSIPERLQANVALRNLLFFHKR